MGVFFTEKYANKFINGKVKNEVNATIAKIIAKEKEYELEVLKWDIPQLEDFLISFNSISFSSLNKHLNILRDFTEFIAEQEHLEARAYQLDFNKLQEFIDYDKLMTYIINYEQYKTILTQLKKDGNENIRDTVIFELAWNTLSNDEIKQLKKTDIEFVIDNTTDIEVAILTVGNRTVRISDTETVEDIKECMIQEEYYVIDKNGVAKKMKYKASEYLIKPVLVGKSKDENYISNPSIVMSNAMKIKEVVCAGINTNELTIEDIRRSKIVYMLAPENEKFFSFDFLNTFFDFGNSQSSLYWYRNLARLKYAELNE